MREDKSSQRGAVMIEILAVISMAGVLGSLLFGQLYRRHEELDNIQRASEIRIVREAFSAFIQAEKPDLFRECPVGFGDTDLVYCSGLTDLNKAVADYAPATHTEAVEYSYDYYLYGYSTWENVGPIQYFGLIIPNDSILPKTFKLKRAMRVASLIGADGGIYSGDGFVGPLGSWSIDSNTIPEAGGIYVAVTSMDVYIPQSLPDQEAENKELPDNIAFGRLHAWNYFSVGDRTGNGCYEQKRTGGFWDNEHVGDEIKDPGSGCDPLFWVGEDSGTNATTGHVYARNNLYTGIMRDPMENSIIRQTVALETDETDDANRRLVVYNMDGDEKVVIDATGKVVLADTIELNASDVPKISVGNGVEIQGGDNSKILVKTEDSSLIFYDGQIISSEVYKNNQSEANNLNYSVDPAYTSLMNEIRLGARGGATLDKLLPNYILMDTGIFTCDSSDWNTNRKCTITAVRPDCPMGYERAFITGLINDVMPQMDGGDVGLGHTHTDDGNERLGAMNPGHLALKIKSPYLRMEEGGGKQDKDILFELNASFQKDDKNTNPPPSSDLQFWWQTYCVWDRELNKTNYSPTTSSSGTTTCADLCKGEGMYATSATSSFGTCITCDNPDPYTVEEIPDGQEGTFNNCTDCCPGRKIENNLCVLKECYDGYFKDQEDACHPCNDSDTEIQSSPEECEKCEGERVYYEPYCLPVCKDGKEMVDGECVCPENMHEDEAGVCECDDGFVWSEEEEICVVDGGGSSGKACNSQADCGGAGSGYFCWYNPSNGYETGGIWNTGCTIEASGTCVSALSISEGGVSDGYFWQWTKQGSVMDWHSGKNYCTSLNMNMESSYNMCIGRGDGDTRCTSRGFHFPVWMSDWNGSACDKAWHTTGSATNTQLKTNNYHVACRCDSSNGNDCCPNNMIPGAEGMCICDEANGYKMDYSVGCVCDTAEGYLDDGNGGCVCDTANGYNDDGNGGCTYSYVSTCDEGMFRVGAGAGQCRDCSDGGSYATTKEECDTCGNREMIGNLCRPYCDGIFTGYACQACTVSAAPASDFSPQCSRCTGKILKDGNCVCDEANGYKMDYSVGCVCDTAEGYLDDGNGGCVCDTANGYEGDGNGGCTKPSISTCETGTFKNSSGECVGCNTPWIVTAEKDECDSCGNRKYSYGNCALL